MPVYEYRCPNCRQTHERFHAMNDPARNHPPACPCGARTRRKFSFAAGAVFESYFDAGIGRYVTSRADLDAKCRQQSEANEARTGVPSNIVAYEKGDYSPADLGVTDQGMQETHDRAVQEKRIDPAGKIVF